MYQKIKTLAESAIALQNKGAMDAALREIGALAGQAPAPTALNSEKIVLMELARGGTVLLDGRFVRLATGDEQEVLRQMADAKTLVSAPTGFAAKAHEGESKFEPAEFPFAREETATAAIALTEASLTDALAGMLSDVGAGASVPAAFDQNFDSLMGAPKIGALAELAAAKESTEDVDLSPEAQAMYESEARNRFKEMEKSVRLQSAKKGAK